MIRFTTHPDALNSVAPPSVAAARPEGQPDQCPAATGAFRGLVIGSVVVMPIWAAIGALLYFIF
jgi:hypothetical protein